MKQGLVEEGEKVTCALRALMHTLALPPLSLPPLLSHHSPLHPSHLQESMRMPQLIEADASSEDSGSLSEDDKVQNRRRSSAPEYLRGLVWLMQMYVTGEAGGGGV
jgi:hypothetical protein